MPGTTADENPPLAPQLHIAADEIDDIGRLPNLLFGVEQTHR
jgi:hypothetical protein